MKHLRALAALLMLVSLVSVSAVFAQPAFEVPLYITDGVNSDTMYIGIVPGAVFGVNFPTGDTFNGHTEAELPPVPPGGVFDARVVWPRSGSSPNPPAGFGVGTRYDYRPFTSLTQRDSFRVNCQLGTGTGIQISWPAGLNTKWTSMTLIDQPGSGSGHTVNMLTATSVDFSDVDPPNFRIYTLGPLQPPPPGPCFVLPAWPGASANVGGFTDIVLNATNPSTVNALNVTGAVSDNPDFTVQSPVGPFSILAGGSVPVVVRFTPAASGPSAGNITFTHNPLDPACGSGTTTVLGVTGTGISNSLLFASDSRTHLEDNITYQDTLRLVYQGPGALKAQQLRLVLQGNGTTGMVLQGVTRGNDLPAGTFSFATQIHYGPANADGTTNDTVSIVWYGNANNSIAPGTYNDLIRFRYGAGHVSPNPAQVVHVQMLNLASSHPNGDPVTVSPDADQIININPRGVNGYLYGDVNHDSNVDIIDLLLIVDYILGRPIVGTFDFTLGDLAPWTAGNPAPTPDGVINVQDLSLLQQIILTGMYPDGSPSYFRPAFAPVAQTLNRAGSGSGSNGVATLTPGKDAKLTFYISNSGISVRLESILKVKGIQLEFNNVPSVPTTMNATTLLGDIPYVGVDNKLRVLMYNREARSVNAGDMMVWNMPFGISAPELVGLNRYIIAGEQNQRIEDVEIEIVHGSAPELPLEYMLYQNYPNPFNPSTSVRFSVPELSDVKIAIYNLLGQELQVLFDQKMDRGTKFAVWNGRDKNGMEVSSGTYVVRMIAGTYIASRKMMFVK